jgi:predicted dehydrogenase
MQKSKSTGGGASDPAAIGHHGHRLQFADLLDAIRKQRPPAVDGHEGRRSIEIIQAIYKSAEAGGKVVKLPLKGEPVHRSMSGRKKG